MKQQQQMTSAELIRLRAVLIEDLECLRCQLCEEKL
jgi:hypothetical protein